VKLTRNPEVSALPIDIIKRVRKERADREKKFEEDYLIYKEKVYPKIIKFRKKV
jgi:hypothetical protein